MQRLISAICAGLILGTGLILAFAQPADDAQERLQGTWTATKAEFSRLEQPAAATRPARRLERPPSSPFQVSTGQSRSMSPSCPAGCKPICT
jgi:hypothetical protein